MRHDKFLYANMSSTKSLSNDGGRTKRGLTDWAYRTSTHEASPSRSTAKGEHEGFAHNPHLKKYESGTLYATACQNRLTI